MKKPPPPAFDPKSHTRSLAAQLNATVQPGEKIIEVSVKDISPDPDQDRKYFDSAKLQQLADSIEATGQITPVVLRRSEKVKTTYMLVAGERRWRAVKDLTKLKTLKAVVRDLTDEDVVKIVTEQATENWQREGYTPAESVAITARLITVHGSLAAAATASGKPKVLLSKLSNIGKAGEAVSRVLEKGYTDDIETLYALTRLEKKDPAAVDRLVRTWDEDPGSREFMRGKILAALERFADREDDDEPSGRKTSSDGKSEVSGRGTSATHASDRGGSPTASGKTSPLPTRTGSDGRSAQAQTGGRGSGSDAKPRREAPAHLRVVEAELDKDLVTVRTANGKGFSFDRDTLVDVLNAALKGG